MTKPSEVKDLKTASLRQIFVSFLFLTVLLFSKATWAGFFTISGNGSYFKYNYGLSAGAPTYTVAKRAGAGLAYSLASSTSIQFSYSYSNTLDVGAADIDSEPVIYYINKTTEFHTYSLNLVLEFADKKSTFRPFISGGGGLSISKSVQSGTAVDRITNDVTNLTFAAQPEVQSASADASLGFNIYVANSVAIELKGTVVASNLDKEEIYIHYSGTAGLKFVF
jgi:hypothetical protein